jgi:hypothetical protein
VSSNLIPRTEFKRLKPVNQTITGFFFWLSAIFSPLFSAYSRLFWRTNGGQLVYLKPTEMSIQLNGKVSRNGEKKWYTFE